VVHRHRDAHAVARRVAQVSRDKVAIVENVVVRERDALGRPGRAARELAARMSDAEKKERVEKEGSFRQNFPCWFETLKKASAEKSTRKSLCRSKLKNKCMIRMTRHVWWLSLPSYNDRRA
jgi:hypothetical protein